MMKPMNPSRLITQPIFRILDRFGMNVICKMGGVFLLVVYFLKGEGIVREQSFSGNYIVEAPEREEGQRWVEYLEGIRSRASAQMGLEAFAEHRVLVRLTSTLPAGDKMHFHAQVSDGKLDFYLKLLDPIDRPTFLKQLARIFIYEKILPKNKIWKNGEVLPEIPLWLVEGITQELDPSLLDFESIDLIIRRREQLKSHPSLKIIIDWKELSLNSLEAAFQRSYCYAFYSWNFHSGIEPEKVWSTLGDHFLGWMTADREEMEGRWERYLKSFRSKKELFLSWEETEKQFKELMEIPILNEAENELVQWDDLRRIKDFTALRTAINLRQQELMVFETQANFSWRSVIFHYRSALGYLESELQPKVEKKSGFSSRPVNSMTLSPPMKKVTYEQMVALVKEELSAVKVRSQRTTEYLDWFTVNSLSNREVFPFEEYFQTAEKKSVSPQSEKDPYRPTGVKVETLREAW